MSDFTMCSGELCPKKDTCYRYKAMPEQTQCYFMYPPIIDDRCDFFIDVDRKNKIPRDSEIL